MESYFNICRRVVLVLLVQIVTSASIDLQDYTYYFVAAPWLSVKLLRLLQCYPPPGMVQYMVQSTLVWVFR